MSREIATKLAKGTGLSHISFTRELIGKKKPDNTDKGKTKEAFNVALANLQAEHGDLLYKDGHNFFLKEEDVPALKAKIAELEAAVADLKGQLKIATPETVERKQCLYKNGVGTRFKLSEVPGKLKEGYTDHPDKR